MCFRDTFTDLVRSISWFFGTSELHYDCREVINILYGRQLSKVKQRKDNFTEKYVGQDCFVMPHAEDNDSSWCWSELLSNVCTVIKKENRQKMSDNVVHFYALGPELFDCGP